MTRLVSLTRFLSHTRQERSSSSRRAPRTRALRLESLESREMLSVSNVEYQEIREAYQEFNLPENPSGVNIIEISASDLSLTAVKNALDAAATTRQNDLIVVRTTADAYTVDFTKASDEIKFEQASDFFGKTTLVAVGSQSLVIDAHGYARALSLASGSLELGNVAIRNGAAQEGGNIYLKEELVLKNCQLDGGAATLGGNLYSLGSLTAYDSVFSGSTSGQGIYAYGGALALTNCVVNANAEDGLAIYHLDNAQVNASTFSNNGAAGVYDFLSTLELNNATIVNNTGAGLMNLGEVTLADSILRGNAGGGAVNQSHYVTSNYSATLKASRCFFVDNQNDLGAGLYNIGGVVNLDNCAIYGNVARLGGGVYNQRQDDYSNRTVLVNCTVAGNSASSQGGGVYDEERFGDAIYNSIVAMNYVGDLHANLAGEQTLRNNLIGGNPEFVVAPYFNFTTGALANLEEIDLRLTSKSAAVNIGDSARVNDDDLDLAGAPRLVGRNVDAGAYEYQNDGTTAPTRTYVVDTLDDSFNPNDGKTSLREALYWASDANATVTFASSLKGEIKLDSQLLTSSAITIEGNGKVAINAQSKGRALLNESDLTLINLTLKNGAVDSSGGLIYSSGTLTLQNATLDSGKVGDDALGSLVYTGGALNASNSTFTNGVGGSALYTLDETNLRSCSIANSSGVALYLNGIASLDDVTISGSKSDAIVNHFGELTLNNATISDNTGVGLRNIGAASLESVNVLNNAMGGIYNQSEELANSNFLIATLYASHCVVKGNSADNGAGVYNLYGRAQLYDSEISANVAANQGGGLFNDYHEDCPNLLSLVNCTVAGNLASQGGGCVSTTSSALLFLYNSIISQNFALDHDSNLLGEYSESIGCYLNGAPGFRVAPIFDYQNHSLTNAEQLDLRLTQNSPALAIGALEYLLNDLDLDALPRIWNLTVDAGAYQYRGSGQTSVSPNYLVDTLEDSFNLNDDKNTLREALYFANQDGATITFDPKLSGTISLNSQLVASASVTIDGDARVTLDAQNDSRILLADVDVTLQNLTLVNGRTQSAGGAIYASHALTLLNVNLSHSGVDASAKGGAIYSLGALEITESTVTNVSGEFAIYAKGDMTLTQTSISACDNGAVYCEANATVNKSQIANNVGVGLSLNYGALTLANSTISDNTDVGLELLGSASLVAANILRNGNGGLLVRSEQARDGQYYCSNVRVYNSSIIANQRDDSGAGVYNQGGALELYNSVIAQNSAKCGAGVYNEYLAGCANKTQLTNCTVAANSASEHGGGVYSVNNSFALYLYNTIIARNYSTVSNANLEGSATGSVCSLTSGNPGFCVDPIFSEDGKLTNGDQIDLTLSSLSPAIDAGNNERVYGDYDRLGHIRICNLIVDVGAYEYQPNYSTMVTTLEDSFDLSDGAVSLREALYYAQDGDVIVFDDALAGAIQLNETLEVNANVTLIGNSAITLDAQYSVEIMRVNGSLTVSNLTFANAREDGPGAAIYNLGDVTIENATFRNCRGTLGGAIYNGSNATVTLRNCDFSNNTATASGGAIYNVGTLTVITSRFDNNQTQGAGGAIYNAGTLTLVNSSLTSNIAQTYGGALLQNGVRMTSTNCTIAGNSASSGGGVYAQTGAVRLYNLIVAQNTASNGADLLCLDASLAAANTISSYSFANGSNNVLYDGSQPLFADSSAKDYSLSDSSIAIDAGSSQLAIQSGLGIYSTDLSGAVRYLGDSVDIGAYEFQRPGENFISVVQGCAINLNAALDRNQRVLWDLSGDLSGEFKEYGDDFWTTPEELGFSSGVYLLQRRILNAQGSVVSETTLKLQVLDALPSLEITALPSPDSQVVLYSVIAYFQGAWDSRQWRVNWGDQSDGEIYLIDAFVCGHYYQSTDARQTYPITLELLDADGYLQYEFSVGAYHSVPTLASNALSVTPTEENVSATVTTNSNAIREFAQVTSVLNESNTTNATDASATATPYALIDLALEELLDTELSSALTLESTLRERPVVYSPTDAHELALSLTDADEADTATQTDNNKEIVQNSNTSVDSSQTRATSAITVAKASVTQTARRIRRKDFLQSLDVLFESLSAEDF
ncbi:MAG: choice-of-anchor Q domain-containing protein [Planctomycetia bacterium]|nr:choice-of-anchor Q domain-containing protein [Planctomycetia bacterium]